MKIGILAEGTMLLDESTGTRWRVDKCSMGRIGEMVGPELQSVSPLYELSVADGPLRISSILSQDKLHEK